MQRAKFHPSVPTRVTDLEVAFASDHCVAVRDFT